jgi:hypothetical protein
MNFEIQYTLTKINTMKQNKRVFNNLINSISVNSDIIKLCGLLCININKKYKQYVLLSYIRNIKHATNIKRNKLSMIIFDIKSALMDKPKKKYIRNIINTLVMISDSMKIIDLIFESSIYLLLKYKPNQPVVSIH